MRTPNFQLLIIALLASVSVVPLLILPAMVGGIIDYYGMSVPAAGWSASLNFVGGAAASIAVSLRVRRLDLRRLTALGFLLAAAADLCSALLGAHAVSLFLCARLIAGVGAGAAYAALMSSVARRSDADKAYGLLMTLQFAFSAIGLYGVPLLLPGIGIGGLFVVIALLELVAALAVGLLQSQPAPVATPTEVSGEWRVLMQRCALLSVVGVGLYQTANTAQFAYAERMGVAIDLAPETIGSVLGLASILGIPGAACIMLLGARVNRRSMLLLGVAGTALGLLILLFAHNLVLYTVSMCLLGFFWAFSLPYFQTIQADMDRHGSVVAAGAFSATIANAVGPALAALVVGPGNYALVVGVSILFSVLAALSMVPHRDPSPNIMVESR